MVYLPTLACFFNGKCRWVYQPRQKIEKQKPTATEKKSRSNPDPETSPALALAILQCSQFSTNPLSCIHCCKGFLPRVGLVGSKYPNPPRVWNLGCEIWCPQKTHQKQTFLGWNLIPLEGIGTNIDPKTCSWRGFSSTLRIFRLPFAQRSAPIQSWLSPWSRQIRCCLWSCKTSWK